MSTHKNLYSNSDTYVRINNLPLTKEERMTALDALRQGEMIADAILAVTSSITQLLVRIPERRTQALR